MEFPASFDGTKTGSGVSIRGVQTFRSGYNLNYQPGMLAKLAPLDQQVYTDAATVIPSAAVAADVLIQGVISEDWEGFTGAMPLTTLSPVNLNARGTGTVKLTAWGYHPAVLFDQAGGGAAALVNGTFVHSSTRTPGRAQGVAASVAGALVGNAILPAAGLGSNITAGALVQASQTITIAGAPATNDVITVNVQAPYSGTEAYPSSPGVVQYITVAIVLTAAQAASATTAAAAMVAALNANPTFARFYTATNAAGVITITVNGNAQPFLVSFVPGGAFTMSLSGAAGNGVLLNGSAVGGSTFAQGGASLAGGAGFFGTLPMWVAF